MMNGYLEYLAKTVPVISTRQTVINISQMGNIMGDMIYLENGYKTGWQQSCTEDYMGILNRYADDRKNNIPSVVFIACDSIELAKKCSAILSMYRQTRVGTYCYVDDDDYSVYEYDEDGGKEEGDDNRASDCLAINMSISLQPSNGMPHDYIMLTCPQNSPNCAMFYNIAGDDDLQLKVQALDMCTAIFTLICIDESHQRLWGSCLANHHSLSYLDKPSFTSFISRSTASCGWGISTMNWNAVFQPDRP